MLSKQQLSLQTRNSFNIKTICPTIYFPSSLTDLQLLTGVITTPFYILGEGSNTLFVEQQAPTIIKPNFLGISVVELADHYQVTVGAAENWHALVSYCIDKGINGLENLALIPGSVGAAPVQNIGAYGVEFADFCQQVEYFDIASASLHSLTAEECQFVYRNSIFKTSLCNQAIITQVTLVFAKKWRAKLSYNGLGNLPQTVTAKEVMQHVIQIRQKKLPDPAVIPNAGSFFKNPIVSSTQFSHLQQLYPAIPNYPQDDQRVKLAAGWLIEQAGLKGYRKKGVGVHEHQALVLVNYASEHGADIVALAKYIQQQVLAKFDVLLSPEVRMITAQGEKNFIDLAVNDESR
ncbi:MAG: UDP-N-acetylmuramate dehydrogenase [Colwellia sp.]|nr:UDP-N-acetylmuramate dehydrogenase [Colwellia sp.]